MNHFILILLASFLISASLSLETLGIWGRVVGARMKKPALGYSYHVRIATLGRFFIIFSAPIVGFVVDQGGSPQLIATIGFFAFFITAITSLCGSLFAAKDQRSSGIVRKSVSYKFYALASTSFMFTAIGLVGVNFLASIFPDYRASLVQAVGVLTAAGTLIHVFGVDPILASAADSEIEAIAPLAEAFMLSRFISASILTLACLTLAGVLQ